MSLHYDGCRVLVVAHQVIVLCMRYLLEHMTEEQILAIDASGDVANCAITEYRIGADGSKKPTLQLQRYNFVAPLTAAGTPVTKEPDAAVAPR